MNARNKPTEHGPNIFRMIRDMAPNAQRPIIDQIVASVAITDESRAVILAKRQAAAQRPGAVAIQKFNGGQGAVLCSICYVIVHYGLVPAATPPQYCTAHAPAGHQHHPALAL